MIAICDVKEYRSAVCGRGPRAAPEPAHALFDTLHALCNLLLVKPENLHQVCEGETLISSNPNSRVFGFEHLFLVECRNA
ncbi:jg3741 [Pararge aegeria aegeria]|uniref:Jg3741 protein n=1 Tax=Pararge aegeria aegeria TaxID=348720 RepID=A0A8S4QG91_9NEOP|nr:jg3741 [Pararge aegeria aegeria]